jgi:hypothetical protein
MEAMARPPKEGAPTLTAVDVNEDNILLFWTHDFTTPKRGFEIHIDGYDTGTEHRTFSTTVTIGGLDLTQSHCFRIEASYRLKTSYLSNQLCSEAQPPLPSLPMGPPTLSSVDLVAGNFLLSWSQENADPDGGYDVFIDGVDTASTYRTSDESVSISGLSLTMPHCFKIEARYISAQAFYLSNEVCYEVQASNQAPVISGAPVTSITEGESYLFKPSASDPDGDSLTFNIANKPAWASFDAGTGTLSGSPASGTAGLYSGITIRVSDGELSDTLAAFTIEVVEPEPINQAPVISGTPVTSIDEGESYLFKPSASDPDGDSLTFSITNKPMWASFDSTTGTLTGTPQSTDIGSYAEIQITVSDGTDTDQLPAFMITVEDVVVMSSTTLSWIAPTTREDGSVLSISEIDGYRIYMGDSESTLAAVVDINDYSVTDYTLTDIPEGNHYFAVTAYDSTGSESGMSNIIFSTF